MELLLRILESGVYNGMKDFLEHGFKMQEFSPDSYNKEIMENLENIINE